jgi:hypothetical protein
MSKSIVSRDWKIINKYQNLFNQYLFDESNKNDLSFYKLTKTKLNS